MMEPILPALPLQLQLQKCFPTKLPNVFLKKILRKKCTKIDNQDLVNRYRTELYCPKFRKIEKKNNSNIERKAKIRKYIPVDIVYKIDPCLTWTIDEVEPESICAVAVDDDQRVRVVLLALAHFLPVGGQHEAVHDLTQRFFPELKMEIQETLNHKTVSGY
jgi:hypothetical protein